MNRLEISKPKHTRQDFCQRCDPVAPKLVAFSFFYGPRVSGFKKDGTELVDLVLSHSGEWPILWVVIFQGSSSDIQDACRAPPLVRLARNLVTCHNPR